jgi:hypothetical protein
MRSATSAGSHSSVASPTESSTRCTPGSSVVTAFPHVQVP